MEGRSRTRSMESLHGEPKSHSRFPETINMTATPHQSRNRPVEYIHGVAFKKQSNHDYAQIVQRTRQKVQIVKALKVMRKVKPAKHATEDGNVKTGKELLEDESTKWRTISEIEHDAKKALIMKKQQQRADSVQAGVKATPVSRHMHHYDSVVRIVSEIDEENRQKRRLEAARRQHKLKKEKARAKRKAARAAGAGNNSRPPSPSNDAGPEFGGEPDDQGSDCSSLGHSAFGHGKDPDLEELGGVEVESDGDTGDTGSTDSFDAGDMKKSIPSGSFRQASSKFNSPVGRPQSAPLSRTPSSRNQSLSNMAGQLHPDLLAAAAAVGSPGNLSRAASGLGSPSEPGSPSLPGSKRKASVMGTGMVDPKLLAIQAMKAKQEQRAKEALMRKIQEKEKKLLDNKRYAERKARSVQWLRGVMLFSRAQHMIHEVVTMRRRIEIEQEGMLLMRAVVMVQMWWIVERVKIKLKRNPEAADRIRTLVMRKWRINTLRKRHRGIMLMKEFLVESLVLKDMVAKLYGYRKKSIRIQRWVRGFIACRHARILLLSLYVGKVRERVKREKKARERRLEAMMKRELQQADGFGSIMLLIDGVAKQINDVLEVEQQKNIERVAEEQRIAARQKLKEARAAAKAASALTGQPPADENFPGESSQTCPPQEHVRKSRGKGANVKAKFPTPLAFIGRLYQSDVGQRQLLEFRRLIKQQRLEHIAQFEMKEKRKMLSTDCVKLEDVASYLKTAPPPQQPPQKKRTFVRNQDTGNLEVKKVAVGPKSNKASISALVPISTAKAKGKKAAAVEPPKYDDSKLLSEIVHNKNTILHSPFLLLTGSKQLLLDEIKSLPSTLFP